MANVKISELPVVTSVTNSDVLPVVASTTTSQLTMTNLAKSMPQVSSSISASFATTAFTATSASYAVSASFEITYETSSSYADFAVSSSYAVSSSRAVTSSFAISSSFAVSASWAPASPAFPFTGSAQITGSLGVTGSVSIMSSSISLLSSSFQTSVVVGNNKGLIANYIYPVNYYNFDWNDPTISATDQPGFPHFYPAGTNPGFQGYSGVNYYFADVNIGQSINSNKAGVVKLLRDTTTNLPDVEYFTLVSNGNNVSDSVTSFRTANGRNHTLTVTGSLLARNSVSLGTSLTDNHIISGSVNVIGSITGSLFGTSSFAVSASWAPVKIGTSGSSLYSVDPGTSGFSITDGIFLGANSGLSATFANYSNFIGTGAGIESTFAGNSNFLGFSAGSYATNAGYSNFLGTQTGDQAVYASYSNLFGFKVGRRSTGNGIGSNNIIIGTNITLENDRQDSINLGGIIFATGSYATTTGDPTPAPMTSARVGINKSLPQYTLDVSGSGNYAAGLTVTGSFVVTGSFIVPSQSTANPATGSMYVEPAANKLWVYTGNSANGWVTASLGI